VLAVLGPTPALALPLGLTLPEPRPDQVVAIQVG
jgi:hypothetical protein